MMQGAIPTSFSISGSSTSLHFKATAVTKGSIAAPLLSSNNKIFNSRSCGIWGIFLLFSL